MGKKRGADNAGSGGAVVAEPESSSGARGMEADHRDDRRARQGGAPRVAKGSRSRGVLQVYKPGQGYYTRLGTGLFFGVLILWGAHFAFEQMSRIRDDNVAWTLYAQYAVPVGVLAGFGLVLYWLTCLSQRAIDFFIATEGEMKKVSWSSRREVVGSTKVVIGTVIILGTLLFVVDLAFMLFFNWIGVLKIAPRILQRLFGSEG
jgi:preprotein translocase subunit SecE